MTSFFTRQKQAKENVVAEIRKSRRKTKQANKAPFFPETLPFF
jgi:hypothetical protein